jgi:hypothetical protein
VTSSPPPTISPLGRLLSLLGLLAAGLYFTGWIYRWAYFGFFKLQVTSLGLPGESFFLGAFQALCGHPLTVLRTLGAVVIIGLVCWVLVTLRRRLTRRVTRRSRSPAESEIVPFLTGLADELIIVLVILTALFWIARWQGINDAWQDVVNPSSSLPVVTLVFGDQEAALGRNLDDPFSNPTDLRLMGDPELYNRLLGQELTNTDDPDSPRVWRLLLHQDGVFYLFPALPTKDRFLSVPVLLIQSNSSRLTILSPRVVEP